MCFAGIWFNLVAIICYTFACLEGLMGKHTMVRLWLHYLGVHGQNTIQYHLVLHDYMLYEISKKSQKRTCWFLFIFLYYFQRTYWLIPEFYLSLTLRNQASDMSLGASLSSNTLSYILLFIWGTLNLAGLWTWEPSQWKWSGPD